MFFKITYAVLCFISFCTFCSAATPVRRCSGNRPFPLYVQIEDCDSIPCEVTRGTVASMDMQFVAVKDETYDLQVSIHATVLGITVPYILPAETADICSNLLYGANCPLYAEEDVTYHIDLPLDNSIPEVSVKCEVKLVDRNKDIVSCFIADLKVRRPKTSNLLN